jgi:hypothetical protein
MAAIPHYTRWDLVPAGLYSRTQLGRMDPPRRIRPDAATRATVTYHGNKTARLYQLDDSEFRPAPSAAKLAAVLRAGESRYICRFCEVSADHGSPWPERICDRCGNIVRAYAQHLEGRASLAGLHQVQPWRPLYGACTFHNGGESYADRLVLVDPERGLEVVADVRLPGGPVYDEHRTNAAEEWARYTEGWRPHHELLKATLAGRPMLTWALSGDSVRWNYTRWLGRRGGGLPAAMPDATGDLVADARTLATLVTGIVSGAFTPPAPCWERAGITPAQMHPYAGRWGTTRQVVEFVDGLAATPS